MIPNNNFQWFIHLPFLSETQCDDLLKQIKSEESWVKAEVINPDTKSHSIKKYRDCDELFLKKKHNENISNDYEWILKKLDPLVRLTNNKVWNFNIENISGDFRALKYNIGNKFGWHSGTDKGHLSLNKITCLIQLSDPKDFEGGNLHFAFQDDNDNFVKAPYKKGWLFMFPSFANHMVSELISGERYIMRETYIGEPFK
jgi:hypothetical protein